ncbi:ABC transporter substrate-binding protein [Sutterella sp.]|uniref:ABC transporter substrate-binding protein n=1 Tax=Sutterella sp. TaxID=1981025 RepID=UPI0026E10786|nr:ABC transporter substrate-binding protein [Sutterella sp.]MDO5531801.1 ABC transporter substrate-binding protein [Sutterella sp.]
MSSRIRLSAAAAALSLVFAAGGVSAADLTWASAGDILTFDIHSQNENLNITAISAVYEGLIRRGQDRSLEPALATGWKRVPEGFLFTIREGVKFHEGETLTADDVVFSINRALNPRSQFKSSCEGIVKAEKAGPNEVLVRTTNGSPVILNQIVDLKIMNEAWAKAHGALEPQDYIAKEESYAARHANGTGPFKLESRQEDVKTVFVANHDWWDEANRPGNVETATFRPIASASTRTAALLSGEVDFLIDPAPQDLQRLRKADGIKVTEGPENRALLVSLDQHRDASPYIRDTAGKPLAQNPFKDVRVREALFISINRDGIKRGVMRGLSNPSGTVVTQIINGWTKEVGEPPAYDVSRAKKLLAEAGYPQGFGFTLDCPNNRWQNDEATCKALASQWARIGLKVEVNTMPRAKYFPKVLSFDTSAGLVGWGCPTFDALYSLQSLSATFNKATGDGISNIGRVSVPAMDEALNKVRAEEDPVKRTALLTEALRVERENVMHIPVHELMITWAMKKNVDVVHRPDNRLTMEWVNVK